MKNVKFLVRVTNNLVARAHTWTENWQSVALSEKELGVGFVVVATAAAGRPDYGPACSVYTSNASVGHSVCTHIPVVCPLREAAWILDK